MLPTCADGVPAGPARVVLMLSLSILAQVQRLLFVAPWPSALEQHHCTALRCADPPELTSQGAASPGLQSHARPQPQQPATQCHCCQPDCLVWSPDIHAMPAGLSGVFLAHTVQQGFQAMGHILPCKRSHCMAGCHNSSCWGAGSIAALHGGPSMDRDASCALSDTSSTAPLHPYFGMPENLCSTQGLQKAMLLGQPAMMTLDEVRSPLQPSTSAH